MKQKGQRVGPKVPDRAQQRGKQTEKQRHAPARAQQHINAELALRLSQAEQEQRPGGGEAVAPVQRPRKARQAHPEGAQQIVDQTGGQPQQDGLKEYG